MAALSAALLGTTLPAVAQESAGPPLAERAPADASQPGPVLTLDQKRLFEGSAYGRAALKRAETASADLAAENRRIEAALEDEERELTQRRAALAPADFAPLAAAFDTKVEEIRAAQAAKSRDIQNGLEREKKAFYEASVPVLGELLRELGAVAILSDEAIILSLTSLDITDRAIARLDERLPPPAADPPVPPETPPPAPTQP